MIFSGSTAGGSGGRRSLRLPLRSRRAAAALSWAAIFIGDEMLRCAAPRRRRDTDSVLLRARREFSELPRLLALVQGGAPYTSQRCSMIDRSIENSRTR